MDPNANMREELEIARRIQRWLTDDTDDRPADYDEIGRLAELVLAMGEWRSKGGFAPDFGDISEDQSPEAIAEQVERAYARVATVVRPDIEVGDHVWTPAEPCTCDDVAPCEGCLALSELLIGVRVHDELTHHTFTIAGTGTKDGNITVGGGDREPYWALVYDLKRAPALVPNDLHPLQVLHRYLFPERYDAVETYEWTAGTIEDVAAMIERLGTEHHVELAPFR